MAVQISPSAEISCIYRLIESLHQFPQRRELVKAKISSLEKEVHKYEQVVHQCAGLDRGRAAPPAEDAFQSMVTVLKTVREELSEWQRRYEKPLRHRHRVKNYGKDLIGGLAPVEKNLEFWEGELRKVFERGQSVGAFLRPYRVFYTLPPSFVAPQQLSEELLQYVKTGPEQVVVLHGMFGMGKSTLALHVAVTLESGGDFPGGVFVLRFGENYSRTCTETTLETKILDELKTLLNQLGHRPPNENYTTSETAASVKSRLARILPKKYLIVLDDVWSDRIVEAFLFRGHEGKLLVTAREQLWRAGKSFQLLPKHYQDEHLDRTILAKYASERSDAISTEPIFQAGYQERAESILKKCQGCPLAICIIGRILNAEWDEADEVIAQHAKDVVDNFSAYCENCSAANGYKFTIFGAIQASLHILSADQLQVFRTFDIFAPGISLPSHLVELALFLKKRRTTHDFKPYMDGFVRASLIQKSFEGHYIVHSTVADYLTPTCKNVNILLEDRNEDDENIRRHKGVLAIYLLSYGNTVSTQAARHTLKLKDNVVAHGTSMEVPSEKSSLWEMSKDHLLIQILNASAKVRLGLRKWTDAIEDVNEALNLDPKDIAALRTRGAVKIYLDDFSGAKDDLNKALELEPHNASTLGCRARALCMLGRADAAASAAALTDANNALQLDAKNAYALSALGALKVYQKDFAGAMKYLSEAKKLNPDDAFTLIHRSEAMWKSGTKSDAALDEADWALQLNNNSAHAFRVRGELKIHLRDILGAIQDLDNAHVLVPDDAFTLSLRAEATHLLHSYQSKQESYKASVQFEKG